MIAPVKFVAPKQIILSQNMNFFLTLTNCLCEQHNPTIGTMLSQHKTEPNETKKHEKQKEV